MNLVQTEVEKLISKYSTGKYLDVLKEAKEVFIEKTGKIDEDSEEYESRMGSFNDWYLFQYEYKEDMTMIDYHLKQTTKPSEVELALATCVYSLFVFHKINFRKQVVIKDILHDEKKVLSNENGNLPLVEDDVFVGRMVTYNDQNYILNGLCILPTPILSALKKQSKKVRKNKSLDETEFLLNLERLKTKSIQYGHIDPSQIFIF